MSVHLCGIKGCEHEISVTKIVCASCWRVLPRDLQDELYERWRRLRAVRRSLAYGEALRAYRDAVRKASDYIAQQSAPSRATP
jgi:hypothetical protein